MRSRSMRFGSPLLPLALILGILILGGCAAPGPQPLCLQPANPVSGPPIGFTTEERTYLPSGTALVQDSEDSSDDSRTYRDLDTQPGWGRVTRSDLIDRPAAASTEEARTLLSLVHLSDVHIIDAESPLRVEYLRHRRGFRLPPALFQAGFRPQETLSAQVAESMMRQLNALAEGPVTGRPFDLAVLTGDSGDNHQMNELLRFVKLLNGGDEIRPWSGTGAYEGVQDLEPSPIFCEFWHPANAAGVECGNQAGAACGPDCRDKWKQQGFPTDHPDLLEEALVPFTATGLELPWVTTYGNHDELVQGNFPIRPDLEPENALSDLAAGDRKLLQVPIKGAFPELDVDVFVAEFLNPLDSSSDWRRFKTRWQGDDARDVTADGARRLWTREDFVATLVEHEGPYGPRGHGFADVPPSGERLYYAFDLSPEVRGIVLDTTNPGGISDGSLDCTQLGWLEDELKSVHSSYLSTHGSIVEQPEVEDKLVVLLSHHNTQTLNNLLPASLDVCALRVGIDHLERTLFRFPNIFLWLNGHTHYAKILPHPNPDFEGHGFWEINTPSLIDFPQMSRIVEIRDNGDQTLSIFGTLIDHAAPPAPDDSADPVLRLASLSRELAANDPLLELSTQLGDACDRNVELLVKRPFPRAAGDD